MKRSRADATTFDPVTAHFAIPKLPVPTPMPVLQPGAANRAR